jgi:ATP-dependent protease ClpP protease subunit
MKNIFDPIWYFFNYGLEPDTRTIFMGTNHESENTGTDYLMAQRVIKGLHILEKSKGEIRIIMNNEGGFWFDGVAMYDYIRACKNQVVIEVYGQASSMGAILLQAADVRRVAKHAKVMVHYGKDGLSMEHPEIYRRWENESDRIKQEIHNILLPRIREKKKRFAESQLAGILNFDTIYSAQEAVDMGLADEII